MTFRDYLELARERWKIVVAGLLCGLVGAMLLTWITPRVYAASITIYVSAQAGVDDASSAYQGNLLSEQKVRSYTQLLTSHRIAQDVVDELDLDVPPGQLRGQISASAKPQTVLLTVTVTDRAPERARELADAVGAAFSRLVTRLEQPADPNRSPTVTVQVVEPAQLPVAPVSPRPVLNLGFGLVLGLLAGCAGAMVRNALDTSVKSADELRRITDAPNLGSIAFDPDVPLHPLTVHERPQSPLAEAYRQLRTNLQFVDVDRQRKVVVVTSPLAEEGKTTLLCNLGIALAQAGSRVILVEADLRRPRVGDYLGLESAVGVTTVLTGRVGLDQAVQSWARGLLDVLGSGPIPPNPSELLASQQMVGLLAELGKRYDVVLVDAPPLLPVTDAAALATGCDGALLIVRHGRTTRNQVTGAVAALDAVSVRLLGTVLSMAPTAGPDAYYRYYYSDDADTGQRSRRARRVPSPGWAGRSAGAADVGVGVGGVGGGPSWDPGAPRRYGLGPDRPSGDLGGRNSEADNVLAKAPRGRRG